MNTNESGSLQGFKNVRLNGTDFGSIVWDTRTRLIVCVCQLADIPPGGVAWIDGKGCEAYPAFIDGHVHGREDEPGKEDPFHLAAACVAGGVGTIMTMPNNLMPFTQLEQLEARIALWRSSPLTVRFHMGVATDNLEVIAGLGGLQNSWLGEIKEYDASTTNSKLLMEDVSAQYKAAEAIAKSRRRKLVHAGYEPWLKRNRQQIERERRLRLDDHCLIRAPEVEIKGIEQAIQICRDTGVPTHFCHVSTVRGLELIADAKAAGLPVTCETCPHYWLLHSGCLSIMGGRAKMNPALRSQAEMSRIQDCVCQGMADIIASDHAPHKPEEKARMDYDKCPSGVPGVQTLGLTVYDLKARGLISAQRFVDLTSGNAARIFGFNKGELAEGKDADVVLINPDGITCFVDADMKSKCGWTPFNGQGVQGSIAALVLRGQVVRNN